MLRAWGALVGSKLPECLHRTQKNPNLTLTLQSLLFWKKQGFFPNKARFFLFAEPLKSLEKRGKTHKKARKIEENEKKARKSKKARIGGSG